MGGIIAARGVYIIMGDADDSYDFSNLGPFVEKLRGGCDLVMGNRFQGGIKPGAMPPLHKYLGNPVLTWVGQLFFSSPAGDFHCGLRGFRRDSILKLDLQTTGMEFASEMVVKASLYKLADNGSPNGTLSRRPQPSAAPANLARWLAAPPIFAALQSPVAVSVSGCCADDFGSNYRRLAVARYSKNREYQL
jgi:hypothetical protein